jgi:hypothetical protein
MNMERFNIHVQPKGYMTVQTHVESIGLQTQSLIRVQLQAYSDTKTNMEQMEHGRVLFQDSRKSIQTISIQ